MRSLLIGVIILATAGHSFAHGVQIQATYNPGTGKIETREIVHTGSHPAAIADLKRVYVMPLLNSSLPAGNGWYTRPDDVRNVFNVPLYPSGPGLTYQYEDQLAGTGWAYTGSSSLPNLSGTSFGYAFTNGLKQWNGSSFVDAGVEELQIFRGDATSAVSVNAITSDIGPFATMSLSAISTAGASANAHSSVSFRMLGDGINSTVDPDDGIYLHSLQLTSSAPGVNPSDPFYFVMYKNQSTADALTAAQALGFSSGLIQVLPEPASLGLLIPLGALLPRRKGRGL